MQDTLLEVPRKTLIRGSRPVWTQDRYHMITTLRKRGKVNTSRAKAWAVMQYLENRDIEYTLTIENGRYIFSSTMIA